MTLLELVNRDLVKAEKALEQGKRRKGIQSDELAHLHELVLLRKEILTHISERTINNEKR